MMRDAFSYELLQKRRVRHKKRDECTSFRSGTSLKLAFTMWVSRLPFRFRINAWHWIFANINKLIYLNGFWSMADADICIFGEGCLNNIILKTNFSILPIRFHDNGVWGIENTSFWKCGIFLLTMTSCAYIVHVQYVDLQYKSILKSCIHLKSCRKHGMVLLLKS